MRRIILSGKIGCFVFLLTAFPFLINGKTKAVVKPAYIASVISVINLSSSAAVAAEAAILNDSIHLDSMGLSKKTLEYALKGYSYLQRKGLLPNKDILSICDFSQSSKNKRLYIIDIENKKLILNTYVAHGKNSGSEFAKTFSNNPNTLKSSLGFYVTRDTYLGGHGLSLKIQGVEQGFNDKAIRRNIVVHGSGYVGDVFVNSNNACGRSYGCPAVPSQESDMVINAIKNGSCLFIYHPTQKYIKQSQILNS
ncbi:MAG: murein L,D-transpeptidase catalytic domain family protein [Chitinophagaceae bacterium]